MIDVKSTQVGDLVCLDPNLTWHDDWPAGWLTVEGVGRDAQGRTVDVRSKDGRRWMFDSEALLSAAEPGTVPLIETEPVPKATPAGRYPGADQHDEPVHPNYYKVPLPDGGSVEVIDILQALFPTDPLLWNTGKYLLRAGHKGPALPDLIKARDYLNWAIDRDRKKAQK